MFGPKLVLLMALLSGSAIAQNDPAEAPPLMQEAPPQGAPTGDEQFAPPSPGKTSPTDAADPAQLDDGGETLTGAGTGPDQGTERAESRVDGETSDTGRNTSDRNERRARRSKRRTSRRRIGSRAKMTDYEEGFEAGEDATDNSWIWIIPGVLSCVGYIFGPILVCGAAAVWPFVTRPNTLLHRESTEFVEGYEDATEWYWAQNLGWAALGAAIPWVVGGGIYAVILIITLATTPGGPFTTRVVNDSFVPTVSPEPQGY